MAANRTIKFLPIVFRTETNQKFLEATMEQLISEPNLRKINGYIGRQFAPTYKSTDSYIEEPTTARQTCQLEPSIVVRDEEGEVEFYAHYNDILDKIRYHGGTVTDPSRLFDNEFYSFDPRISYDKIVNYSQYYWLPEGPDAVEVNTTGIELTKDFTVTRNTRTGRYDFTSNGQNVRTLNLVRGGTYTFTVDQPGHNFWIQTEGGVDGVYNNAPAITTRDVLGVENNGTDQGTVTFKVPQKDAQDQYNDMDLVATVDYANPVPYNRFHNRLLSDLVADYPQYAGVIGTLDGKTLIFVDIQEFTNYGEDFWTTPTRGDDGKLLGYDDGDIVAEADRFKIWTVQLIAEGDDYLINLIPTTTVNVNEKVYVRFGVANANREFYKDYDGFFKRVPILSSLQDKLYFQDSVDEAFAGEINILDNLATEIDIEADILGKQNYTSPNGVEFTSGLKVRFDVDATPATYQDREYYVENVGDGIRLVDVTLLERPEAYNDEIDLNYPLHRIILSKQTTEKIEGGAVIEVGGNEIIVDSQIDVGGLEIQTLSSIDNLTNHMSVTGTGIPSGTTALLVVPETVFPEYITIKRDHLSLSAWSRNNRWFHREVIEKTAEYNDTPLYFDQNLRAQRPIVQFEGDIELYDYGRIGRASVDIIDTTITDAFNDLEGETYTTALGVEIPTEGLRVIFANDQDPLVKNKIYDLELVYTEADPSGLPEGTPQIKLTVAEDGEVEAYDTLVVTLGVNRGKQFWYDGSDWQEAQQKTSLNQDPLFDVFDENGASISTYERSSFAGTNVFGYKRGTGTNDSVLGFPLSYRTLGTQGDIEFDNSFETGTFTYISNQQTVTENIFTGFLHQIDSRYVQTQRNVWKKVVEDSKQYQVLQFDYAGSNVFELDVVPETQTTIPYVKVFKNNTIISISNWALSGTTLTVSSNVTLTDNDRITVLVYSKQISKIGHFEVPPNLEFNAQNAVFDTLTLGQLRNHLVKLSQNTARVISGPILSSNNSRDIELKQNGGDILHHSAPVPPSALFLVNEDTDFVESVRLAEREYTKVKNKFLEYSTSLPGIDPTDPVASVDLILSTMNAIKNTTFPWYYSDMVPYGTLKNEITYTVFNPLTKSYEITEVFNPSQLQNKAVLVYLNDVQLIKDIDYIFETARPAVTILDDITLAVDDVIKVVEYSNTDGNWIPETPTKLGLYPKYTPQKYSDSSFRTTINVIRGHDGSVTPAFDDYRDDFLLEFEKRIYNNIKVDYDESVYDIWNVIPGKFRDNDYTLAEFNRMLSKRFLGWIGSNKVDYAENSTFEGNDPFTWNYARMVDKINGEPLPGSWRACYRYFYDTETPNTTPWEMLGFAEKPTWWETYYGPGPYTGGNDLLWEDLAAGRIVDGARAGIDQRFVRDGLLDCIPVDDNGNLLPPSATMIRAFDSNYTSASWGVGQIGPTEGAWRRSSSYPYAVQIAVALAKPARYFGALIETSGYNYNTDLEQYLLDSTGDHMTQDAVKYNGYTVNSVITRTAGYVNWIAEYLVNKGINPATKINRLLERYSVELSYKMAGYTDKKYIEVFAEQNSPGSTNDSIVIPDESYDAYLYKSTPIRKIVYSAVIVEKTASGYSVRGYDVNNPYFTIIPSRVNNNAYQIEVLDERGTIYRDYKNLKVTVPYGYEFRTRQAVVDFLVSYERYLISQGFTFTETEEVLSETKNWKLSVKEFLHWSQQGWAEGAIINLSPAANKLFGTTVNVVVDEITDDVAGSRILDQNFKVVKRDGYNIFRTAEQFRVDLVNEQTIGLVELNLVQYEHVLIFRNTTLFNDIIYKPELGNRQYRLKIVGKKTADWDGSLTPGGFIYSSGKIPEWTAGVDYLKGDLVDFKNRVYVALENIPAVNDFDFKFWQEIDKDQIKSGLLPNLSTIALQSRAYYDANDILSDEENIVYGHGLIGFKFRQYLSDLGLNATTQAELYKGFIKQKGTKNAVTALTSATFNNLDSNVDYFEEWAIRVGEFGALDINPFVEVPLDENEFALNPATVEFVPLGDARADGVTIFSQELLYKKEGTYTGNIALDRDSSSNYDNDLPTAGYVVLEDVDATVFDMTDYESLDSQILGIGNGYSIWVAKDFDQEWNVYRVTETDNKIETLNNELDGYISFETQNPHQLAAGDVFLVRNFNTAWNGFYRVDRVDTLNKIIVQTDRDVEDLTELTGDGILYRLDSLRFTYMEDAREYTPPHGWKVGEKIWIDIDAATSLDQGQTYAAPNNTWKVYEKTAPFEIKQNLDRANVTYQAGTGFGTSVKLSYDALIAAVGDPTTPDNPLLTTTGTGAVYTFVRNANGNFVDNGALLPLSTNVEAFGTKVDIGGNFLGAGAPESETNLGYVFIYEKTDANPQYQPKQAIVGNVANVGDLFGTSIAFDEDAKWLYVGAPGNDQVYIYGYDNNINVETQTSSVDLITEISLSGNITANIGEYITQANTGMNVEVTISNVSAASTVLVKGDTSMIDTGAGNTWVAVSGANAAVYPSSVSTSSYTNTLTLDFTPDVTDEADSIFIHRSDRVYVPNIDYTLSGNVVTFTANVGAGTITIEQGPYFRHITTIVGPTGTNFGIALDSSLDGAQLAVGAPLDTVDGLAEAGAVYVYDRVIEAFNATGNTDYITTGNIKSVYRVTVEDEEVSNYTIVGANTIRFDANTAPQPGKVIYVETNDFNLLELLTGSVVQEGAQFGTDMTICSNNCAIYVGAPYYDNGTDYNSGAVFKFHNRGRLYGTNTGDTVNPTFTPGETIRLDNFEVEITGTTLDDVVDDINNANLVGITAHNEDGKLRIDSDKTVAKNLLRILSGSPSGLDGVFADAGMAVFAEMQIIVNPYGNQGEYFGTRVVLAQNAYMLVISSDRGTTRKYTTFDSGTTEFDNDSTAFFDSIKDSGSTYIYELYDDPRDDVEDPGRYQFAQQLNPGDLNRGDQFGSAIDIIGQYIIVGATGDDTDGVDKGSVYIFDNPTGYRGWKLIRNEETKVDIDSVTKMYLYNKTTNIILSNLQFIDPAKGRIAGQAEQEISYKKGYDPAVYNRGNRDNATYNEYAYWNERHIEQVWWDLSTVRYLDYEQGSLRYRSLNWGETFPGSTINLYEWVESDVLPSQYVDNGGEGTPKYEDDSAYVEVTYVDPTTNIISTKYFYWVTDKNNITNPNSTRRLPLSSIKQYIENPKSLGIAYSAVIDNHAVILYNTSQYLSASDTVLHIDYAKIKNSAIIHSEYELLQEGNPGAPLPTKIVNKFIDSLAGVDSAGNLVPDPTLSEADRYGLSIRPRQSMFKNRLVALERFVELLNTYFATQQITKIFDMTPFYAEEAEPSLGAGEYDRRVLTAEELSYVDTSGLAVGYKILVANDENKDGFWTLNELQSDRTWETTQTQAYKTEQYWQEIDWYATGYSSATKVDYVVATRPDALKLPLASGLLIYISNTGSGEWEIVEVNDALEFVTVGVQNGTIEILDTLYDYEAREIGFGNQGYDIDRWDESSTLEARYIMDAFYQNALTLNTEALNQQLNDIFFSLINYIFTEQGFVDWIFKTSFISVTHKLRTLEQFPNYIRDNQTYYQSYIEEVKPYKTKIREYLINYNGDDSFEGDVTDFDLPPYYDQQTATFRSPSGEIATRDQQLLANDDRYTQWYANRNHQIESITVIAGGSGYTEIPTVTIVSDNGSGAAATAVLDYDTGSVIRIDVTNGGSGYFTTPIVQINGNGSGARAYADLKNNQVRSISTTMKFDRISYTSSIVDWTANTAYTEGQIISYNGQGYSVNSDFTSNATFEFDKVTSYGANLFATANDRIMSWYDPTSTMPAKDLGQLLKGINYPGVQVQGAEFIDGFLFDQNSGRVIDSNFEGIQLLPLTVESETTAYQITFNANITANVGDFITQSLIGSANAEIISNVVANTANVIISVGEFTEGSYPDQGWYGNIEINGDSSANLYPISIQPITRDAYYNGIDVDLITLSATLTSNIEAGGTVVNVGDIITQTISGANVIVKQVFDGTGNLYVQKQFPNDFNTTESNVALAVIAKNGANVTGVVVSSVEPQTIPNNYWYDDPTGATGGNIYVYNGMRPYNPTLGWSLANVSTVAGNSVGYASTVYDQIGYTADGQPILDEQTLDSIIRSSYTDMALGTRPEDINIEGGAYVDTYSSHAPEELVPGRVFDTLNMRVYTDIDISGNTVAIGYRIFNNMLGERSYTRIADNYATFLMQDLELTDTEIVVYDSTVLPTPSPENAIPGVIYVNGERITYYVKNDATNTLSQIRRGTWGTAAPTVQRMYSPVVDGSIQQDVPGIVSGNVTIVANASATYTTTTTPTYGLRLSGNITPKIGDFITQTSSGTNVTVISTDVVLKEEIELSGNITANVGDYITQSVSGANAEVVYGVVDSDTVRVRYITGTFTTLTGNIQINGGNVAVYPRVASDRNDTIVGVTYNNANTFSFSNVSIQFSSNITANIGDYITQSTTGANLEVKANVVTGNVTLRYVDSNILDFGSASGNIAINGTTSNVYPVAGGTSFVANTEIEVNGVAPGVDVYPLADNVLGEIDENGNVTVTANATANITLSTIASWYNQGANIATDGTGLEGSTTTPALFLKDQTAQQMSLAAFDGYVDEDAVNIITAESGEEFIRE